MADDDRLLNLVGAVLGAALIAAVVVIGLAAVNAPDQRTDPPDADWRLERVNETHVAVVHAGGEPIEAESLMLTVEGYRRATSGPARLTDGDALVAQAAPGRAVRLYWQGGRGDRALLANWEDGGGTVTP